MSEKTKTVLQEVSDVFIAVFRVIKDIFYKIVDWVKTWRWPVIRKIIGIVIVVGTSIAIALDTIIAALLLLDPNQVASIIHSYTGLHLFDYMTYLNYYGLVFGWFVIDIVTLTLLMWFGLWLWKKWNLFNKPRHAWWYAVTAGLVGLALLMASVFYMLPGLSRLADDLPSYHKNHHLKPAKHMRYHVPGQINYYSGSREAEAIFDQINRDFKQFDQAFEKHWR